MRIFEWWAIDKHGQKHHEYHKTSTRRESKVKKQIQRKYKIDLTKCQDFGIKEVLDER